jgi:hypothetical protein
MSVKQQHGVSTPLVDVAPDDLRRLPRPHKGFDVFASRLATFYRQNEAALRIDGIDIDAMLADVQGYVALAETEYAAQRQLAKVQATRLVHASSAWKTMLEIYARAATVGRVNAAIRAGIAEFADFMKQARKKKTPATATTTA